MRETHSSGVCQLVRSHAAYPSLLQQIFDPPPVLYVSGQGDWERGLGATSVALVGSRDATSYGIAMARSLGRGLAESGVTVVSGLALGVDAAAHAGALEAEGTTVAVVGSGIDVIYPRRNRRLREEILRCGLLVAEWPLGTQPRPAYFPQRNRIISGLSLAVVVVEAGQRSGALGTARQALEQGREVLAVPGPAGAPRSVGPNGLLKAGAGLVETVDDILDALPLARRPPAALPKRDLPSGSSEVLAALAGGARTVDEIAARSGKRTQEVWSQLLQLEVRGLIQRGPAGRFERVQGGGRAEEVPSSGG